MHVDAFVESGSGVTIEAYFGDGKPVVGARVRVRNQAGREIASATTDAQGRYINQPATAEPVTIEVVQAAHRGTVTLGRDLLAQTTVAAAPEGHVVPASRPVGQQAAPPAAATRMKATSGGNLVPGVAGIALILAGAAFWQVRSLRQRVEKLSRQIEAEHDGRRTTDH